MKEGKEGVGRCNKVQYKGERRGKERKREEWIMGLRERDCEGGKSKTEKDNEGGREEGPEQERCGICREE